MFLTDDFAVGADISLVCKELQGPRGRCRQSNLPQETISPHNLISLQGDPMRARIFLVFVLLAAVSLSAQTFRGTILGTVTDPSGAVVSGATVMVKNTGTGLERSTQTSGDGSYSLPELPIGTYNVTVTQSGFQMFVAKGVTVDVATERRVDASLKTGEITT